MYIPQQVRTKIRDADRALEAASGGKQKYLKFSALMNMAKEVKLQGPAPQSVMWTDQVVSYASDESRTPLSPQQPRRSREFWSRNSPYGKNNSRSAGERQERPQIWKSGQSC